MPSLFHCSPVIREWSWKKTQIEKKKQKNNNNNYGNLVQMIPWYRSIYTQHSTQSKLKSFLAGYWYKERLFEKRAKKVCLKHICIKQIPFLFDRHIYQQISGKAIISGKLALPAPYVFLWMKLDSTSQKPKNLNPMCGFITLMISFMCIEETLR